MEQKTHAFTLPLHTVAAHNEERFVLDAGEEMTAFLHRTYIPGRSERRLEKGRSWHPAANQRRRRGCQADHPK